MYLVHVMPIARGVFADSLSYFSKDELPAGTIVSVPIRSRSVVAFVLGSEKASDAKAAIKASPFPLKRLERVRGAQVTTPAYMRAVHRTARYHATPPGLILEALIPKQILLAPPPLTGDIAVPEKTKEKKESSTLTSEPYRADTWMLQASDTDRAGTFRSVVRESFNKGKSVYVMVPTVEDALRMQLLLARGIEDRTFLFTGVLTPKKLTALWRNALTATNPILAIGTPQFLSLPRADWGTIIVERESARSYKTLARPFVDARIHAEYVARELGARLVLADTLVRPETFFYYEQGRYGALTPPSSTIVLPQQALSVDMHAYKAGNGTFRVISIELEDALRAELDRGGKAFIFVARKGLSPTTVCNDCGSIVRCTSCSAPVVLHRRGGDETRTFICHACGQTRPPEDACSVCGSWRFTLLGISTSRVAQELHERFPNAEILTLDSESTGTPAAIKRIATQFATTKKSILVGTEMALPHLPESVGVTAIASLDALLSVPDFRMTERIIRIAVHLRERAERAFIFQTRMPDHPTLAYVLAHNMRPFYREELAAREQFGYPPFGTFIKISVHGKGGAPVEARDGLAQALESYSPQSYETSVGDTVRAHLLLKLPAGAWPEKKLEGTLRSLSPAFIVKVDPDDLL
ncbi:MAG: hypothetical protein A2675_01705 [Candidatus Yonathbacteria bacterium RIFCSPHIGHO2_01_FULL_51_10]|uniref:Primosomal protein N' 3' DNA-binding domain-containing protein n=1 Tax=Candidatus Yonathbacteria bacterium RIFCSPHIGHO2_01_FULL_51_10 TaxID=1802723 RepID=A0A1G2S8B3_9BACT|nr:MAG: hypothetical protein A2675_01705 [Candidatus Yonathbacteria bacterium RIFCSPHIGHO2_01_FULL_51_10]